MIKIIFRKRRNLQVMPFFRFALVSKEVGSLPTVIPAYAHHYQKAFRICCQIVLNFKYGGNCKCQNR